MKCSKLMLLFVIRTKFIIRSFLNSEMVVSLLILKIFYVVLLHRAILILIPFFHSFQGR